MKNSKILSLLVICFISSLSYGQLYTPNGTISGNTTGSSAVGIGTDNPRFKLEVANLSGGTSKIGISSGNTSYALEHYPGAQQLRFQQYTEGFDKTLVSMDFKKDYVGIGTAYPRFNLEVASLSSVDSKIGISCGATSYTLEHNSSHKQLRFQQYTNGGFDKTLVTMDFGKERLTVDGLLIATQVRVLLKENWPDYVFDNTYKLRSLDEVENYISINKHLPNVPSAADVKKDGIDVAQMDAILLQKIEELTLYMIEMKKDNEALKVQVELLK